MPKEKAQLTEAEERIVRKLKELDELNWAMRILKGEPRNEDIKKLLSVAGRSYAKRKAS